MKGKDVSKIRMAPVEVREAAHGERYRHDESAPRYVEQLVQAALAKKQIAILSPVADKDDETPNTTVMGDIDVLNAKVIVHSYGVGKVYVPSSISEYTDYYEVVRTNSKGQVSKVKLPIVKTRVNPERWDAVAYTDIEFLLINPETGKNVFNYRDTRSRYGKDPYSMAERIVDGFMSKLNKVK